MKKFTLTILLQLFLTLLGYSQSFTIPYYTGFDSQSEKEGWQQFRKGYLSASYWKYSGNAYTAPNCLSHERNINDTLNYLVDDWFVSPPFDFAAFNGGISLKYFIGCDSTLSTDSFEIWFGTGNPNPSLGSFHRLTNLSNMRPTFEWLDTLIYIPYTSDSGYVAFRYKSTGKNWTQYLVDNIIVDISGAISNNHIRNSTNSIQIVPNPFSSSTKLVLNPNLLTSALEIRMFDMLGKEVKRMKNITNSKVELYKDNLPKGVYIVSFYSENQWIENQKIIIE